MSARQRQDHRRRQHAPGRNTLGSTQLPSFASKPRSEPIAPQANTFRVPSPTDSEEEDIRAAEVWSLENHLPEPPETQRSRPDRFRFSGNNLDSLSLLGSSSTLFSDRSATESPATAK